MNNNIIQQPTETESIIQKSTRMMSKIVDKGIEQMLNRNGINTDNMTKENAEKFRNDLKEMGLTLNLRDNTYNLWKNGIIVDSFKPKFEFIQNPLNNSNSVRVSLENTNKEVQR